MVENRLLQVGSRSETGDLAIINGKTSVLSNLGSAGGIDYTHLRHDDDIWHSGVRGGISESLVYEALARDDVRDLQGIAFPVEIVNRSVCVAAIAEEYQCNIVRGNEVNWHHNGGWKKSLVDLAIQLGVDGSLSVLRCNDNQSVVEDSLCLQASDDLADGTIHEVKSGNEFGSEVE